MDKKEILNRIMFAGMIGMILGIFITIFAKENTQADNVGKIIVVLSFLVIAAGECIRRFIDRKKK